MDRKIHYIFPDFAEPNGGVKICYKHVEMLNRNHFNAGVVHFTEGFRANWFANDVPVTTIHKLRPGPSDFLVIPAAFSIKLANLGKGMNKVIINQGCYLTFNEYPITDAPLPTPYRNPDVKAVIVVSEDSQRYLQYVFPHQNVVRVRNYIDPKLFKYREDKKRQIAFMTGKRYGDIQQVINILRYRGILDSYSLAPIENRSEQEVASIMGESLIFLNFCLEEGFSLPAAEAMSCGCIVVGNHGYGAREFMLPEFSYPIPQGDIIQFARTVESVVTGHERRPAEYRDRTKAAAAYIQTHYTETATEQELVSFWDTMLAT